MKEKDQPTEFVQKSASVYQSLFELASTPTSVFDFEGRCHLANRSFSIHLGYDEEVLLGGAVRFSDLFGRRDSGNEFVEQIRERQVIRRWEVELKDKEERRFPALASGRILDYLGETSFEFSFTDISQQKALQGAIETERARLLSLIDNLTAGLLLVDRDGEITELNLALANLLNIEQEELIGQPYQHFFAQIISNTREPELVQQWLGKAILNVDERPTVEFSFKNERPRHLEITVFPVRDKEGMPLGWGGLLQDITELREQTAWKLELLSILAHDIRSPLATLKGHATALLANYQHWGDDMVTEFLEAIDRSTDDLIHQVDRNLALTRVEAGRLGLRPEAVGPERLIRQAIERIAGPLGKTEVQIEVPKEIPQVRADPARAEEVLVNLLENAMRYTPAGEPILVKAKPQDNWVTLSVIDRGQGVPKENQREIFNKYVQKESEGGGTGLGLYISRKIIDAHGGRIWVESPPPAEKQGAAFRFTLPVMPSQIEEKREADLEFSAPSEGSGEGVRVLVVEDEADFQALMRTILVDAGYEVEVASEGETALDIMKASPPDIILLDWVLPDTDGISICRNIRRWSNVPILVVTSKSAQEDLIAALDAGADDYMIKPFGGEELLARIRALLRRGRGWKAQREERDQYSVDGLLIDYENREVWLSGEPIKLTATEFDLLAYLSRHPRQVLTYDQLIDTIWGPGEGGSRHALSVHVSRLRKKIERDPKNPLFIRTRWGVGYTFLS